MSDEQLESAKNEEVQGQVPNEGNEEEKVLNPIEKIATDYGWKPEGKRTAEDFIKYALEKFPERGEALTAQNKELFKMKAMLNELASHVNKQKELAYQDLVHKREQAELEGDTRTVEALKVQEQQMQPKPAAVQEFEYRHADWLNSPQYEHVKMKRWLLEEDRVLGQYNLSPEQHMQRLEEHLHKEFPEFFGAQIEAPIAAVESEGSNVVKSGSSKKRHTFSDLSDVQKSVAKYLKDSGTMTIEKYIDQLVKQGDLK